LCHFRHFEEGVCGRDGLFNLCFPLQRWDIQSIDSTIDSID